MTGSFLTTATYTIGETETGCSPPALRAGAAALLAAPSPASGIVTVWAQGTEIGRGVLDAAGEATIEADTRNLDTGSYQLSIRYSGDASFAETSITGSLVVQAAGTTSASPAAPITTEVTSSESGLADTGTDSRAALLVAAALLVGGVGLLTVGRIRKVGIHR